MTSTFPLRRRRRPRCRQEAAVAPVASSTASEGAIGFGELQSGKPIRDG